MRILTESLPQINQKKLGLLVKCITRVSKTYEAKNSEN